MQSMEEIYRQHAQTVYRYLLARTRSADLAEELTQETFYQAVRTAKESSPHGSAALRRTSCAPISAAIRRKRNWMKRRLLRTRRMKRFLRANCSWNCCGKCRRSGVTRAR